MNKGLLAGVLAALCLLAGCAAQTPGEGPMVTVAPEIEQKLFISLPDGRDAFFERGYEYFLDEIARQQADGGFTYELSPAADAPGQAADIAAALDNGFNNIYVHPIDAGQLADTLAAAHDGGARVTLFLPPGHDGAPEFEPDLTLYIDCADMAKQLATELSEVRKAYKTTAPLILALPFDSAYGAEFLSAFSGEMGSAFEIAYLSGNDAQTAVSNALYAMDKTELARVFAIIAPDADSAKAAAEAVLSFTGSVSLKVKRVAYLGATVDSLERMSYAAIDEIAVDLTPVMMISAARQVRNSMVVERQGALPLKAPVITAVNAADFMLSESYLIRYHETP